MKEVDAVRALSGTHTQAGEHLGARDRFDSGTEVTIELMQANGLATRKGDIPVKVLAKGGLSRG